VFFCINTIELKNHLSKKDGNTFFVDKESMALGRKIFVRNGTHIGPWSLTAK
jgi:hypothetical protein